ncbi:DUF6713 family protein [Paenibacillus sp. TAF43_2]|uniref:DUF6713 family protein n=1 Tax=Paenibacillus sp. TAF43_2 TaxID=3233069 RepID=UPI003F949486
MVLFTSFTKFPFLLHEMDAILRSEWKLFFVLQDMDDAKAYKVFTLIHLPLYTIILALLFSQYQTITFWVINIFLMIHAILHLFFEKYSRNEFKNTFSRLIIYPMGILAAIHLLLSLRS